MEIKEELSLEDIDKLLLQEEELNLTSDIKQQISESYEFLKEFSKEKVYTVSIPVSGLWLNGRLKKKTWKNYNTI